MLPSGSKYFFGLAGFAYLAAVLYGAASGVHHGTMAILLGPLTLGYKGPVGDHLGYTVLIGLAAVSAFIGSITVAFRDGDAAAAAEYLGTESVPETSAPQSLGFTPVFAAFGMGAVLVGLVVGPALFLLGAICLALVTVEWAAKAWSDRATGDPEVNRSIRNRVMYPLEIPVLGAIVIGFFVLGISRILLALPKIGADVVFGVVPVLILGLAVLVANRQRIGKNVIVALLLIGGIIVLVGGVVSAAAGRHVDKKSTKPEHGIAQLHIPQLHRTPLQEGSA